MAPDNSRSEIIEALQNGNRDPIDDADDIDSNSGLQGIDITHQATDGSVILHYNYYTSYDNPIEGETDEFNIFEE